MRLTVVHDARGNIATLIACPAEAPSTQIQLTPGQRTTEVDAPEIQLDLGVTEINRRLSELMQDYRIDLQSATGRLARKT